MVSDDNETNRKKRTRLFTPRGIRKGQEPEPGARDEETPVEASTDAPAAPELEMPADEQPADAPEIVEPEPEPEPEPIVEAEPTDGAPDTPFIIDSVSIVL